ncbi:hypothetical protein FHT76_005669 [Rhizobium sp. BK176]|nr:hypothetical protein [Rhizobium sp. BK661]MCS4093969.1 hypothetical protein [Rhizobium sp. BK176]
MADILAKRNIPFIFTTGYDLSGTDRRIDFRNLSICES